MDNINRILNKGNLEAVVSISEPEIGSTPETEFAVDIPFRLILTNEPLESIQFLKLTNQIVRTIGHNKEKLNHSKF